MYRHVESQFVWICPLICCTVAWQEIKWSTGILKYVCRLPSFELCFSSVSARSVVICPSVFSVILLKLSLVFCRTWSTVSGGFLCCSQSWNSWLCWPLICITWTPRGQSSSPLTQPHPLMETGSYCPQTERQVSTRSLEGTTTIYILLIDQRNTKIKYEY